MALVSVARRPSGQYSLISVTAFGIAAPSPRPVTKRQTTSSVRPPERAEAKQETPKTSTELIKTALRPKRSASGPAESAPKAKPNNAALKTGASAGQLHAPLGGQGGSDVADRRRVKPVQQNDTEAECKNRPLEAGERVLVQEGLNVNCTTVSHRLPPLSRDGLLCKSAPVIRLAAQVSGKPT